MSYHVDVILWVRSRQNRFNAHFLVRSSSGTRYGWTSTRKTASNSEGQVVTYKVKDRVHIDEDPDQPDQTHVGRNVSGY